MARSLRCCVSAVLLVLGWLSVLPVSAVDRFPEARITEVQGPVWILRSGMTVPITVQTGDHCYAWDVIKTGKDASARIVTRKQDSFLLGSQTHVVIQDTAFADINTPKILLWAGRVKAVFSRVFKRDFNSIQTPSAMMAIKGTRFEAVVAADGATRIAVEHGQVSLSGQDGSRELQKEQTGDVDLGSDPREAPGTMPDMDSFLAFHKQHLEKEGPEISRVAAKMGERSVVLSRPLEAKLAEYRKERLRLSEQIHRLMSLRAEKELTSALQKLNRNYLESGKIAERIQILANTAQGVQYVLKRVTEAAPGVGLREAKMLEEARLELDQRMNRSKSEFTETLSSLQNVEEGLLKIYHRLPAKLKNLIPERSTDR